MIVDRPAYLRAWNQRNPDKIREYNRRWRKKNPNYHRKWVFEHPDNVRSSQVRYSSSPKGKAKSRRQNRLHGPRRLTTYQLAIWWYKSTHPCIDCGETDPVVLEFDHAPGTKRKKVSTFQSLKSAWEEIQKCNVVCSNCHTRREYVRRYAK